MKWDPVKIEKEIAQWKKIGKIIPESHKYPPPPLSVTFDSFHLKKPFWQCILKDWWGLDCMGCWKDGYVLYSTKEIFHKSKTTLVFHPSLYLPCPSFMKKYLKSRSHHIETAYTTREDQRNEKQQWQDYFSENVIREIQDDVAFRPGMAGYEQCRMDFCHYQYSF
jgi:hypothetical protein